jgi:hypothetical protein
MKKYICKVLKKIPIPFQVFKYRPSCSQDVGGTKIVEENVTTLEAGTGDAPNQ